MKTIEIPEELRELLAARRATLVLSLSGGKDSVAMALACKDAGLDFRLVTADTRWEAAAHYEYLEQLPRYLEQPIDIVGKPGGMPGQLAKGRMPGRMQRWCTEELKKRPLLKYHEQLRDELGDTVAVIGIRREEATTFNTRGSDPAWEWSDEWDGWIWRPILDWSIEDVLNIHARHRVPVHPLYRRGHDRVGCYPCIFSGKEELRLIALHEPKRIEEIREYEAIGTARRKSLNAAALQDGKPPKYTHEDATFFQTQRRGYGGIDKVVEWARTDRGGRQFPLFAPAPRGGCMRWGMCDLPTREGSQQ